MAERVGRELVGFQDRSASYDEMRGSVEIHFIKTHRQRDDRIHEADRAICLVRDGRDALVSYAHLRSTQDRRSFKVILEESILTREEQGTGGWGQNVLSWLQPPAENRTILRYDDLVKEPATAVAKAMKTLHLDVQPHPEATIPTFTELKQVDEGFFRRGQTGTYQDEMPDELQDRFWSIPDNLAAMTLIGAI